MAAIYDAQGNYMGDDGAPDLDQMKLELTKKNIPLASQIPGYGRPVPPAQTKPDPLGAAAGNFTELATKFNPLMMMKSMQEAARTLNPAIPVAGAWADVAQNVQTAGAEAMYDILGNRKGIEKMQQNYVPVSTGRFYQEPTTQFGKEFESGVAKAMDASKIPAMWPMAMNQPIRPPITPNDVRVMGAEATRVGRQVRDIPTDFYNAQSGLQKLDPITGQPTMGAKLQGVAESVGDVMAQREMQGLPPIPGLPASMQPTSPKLYAMRPEGSRITSAVVPPTAKADIATYTPARDIVSNVIDSTTMTPLQALDELNDNILSKSTMSPVRKAFENFIKQRASEMYPDAPTIEGAVAAYKAKFSDKEASAAQTLGLYDEFLQTPEGEQFKAAHNLPTAEELPAMHEAAANWLNSQFTNYILEKVGTPNETAAKLASQGLTFVPPDEVYNLATATGKDIGAKRTKAGMPAKTPTDEALAAADQHLVELQQQAREASNRARKQQAIALQQGYGAIDPNTGEVVEGMNLGRFEPFAQAAREASKLEEAYKKQRKIVDNLRLGAAYENATDVAVYAQPAKNLKEDIEYKERQFYPALMQTPDESLAYTANVNQLRNLGFEDIAQSFYSDVMARRIPLNKVPKMTVENYIRSKAEERIAKEKKEQAAQAAYKTAADNQFKVSTNAYVPNDKVFGNVGALEITNKFNPDQVAKLLSEDTTVLDHCIGEGGGAKNKMNLWYPNAGNRRYEPIYDVSTGERNPNAPGARMTYIDAVRNGAQMVSFRDVVTGEPIATFEFTPYGGGTSGRFNIGWASGHRNGEVKPAYVDGIKSYLNSRTNDIVNPGSNLEDNLGIIDRDHATTGRLAQAASIPVNEFRQLQGDINELPRFVTSRDVREYVEAAKARGPQVQAPVALSQRPSESLESYLANGVASSIDGVLDSQRAQFEEAGETPNFVQAENFFYGIRNDFNEALATERNPLTVIDNLRERLYDLESQYANSNRATSNIIAEGIQDLIDDLQGHADYARVRRAAEQAQQPRAVAQRGDPMPDLETSDLLTLYRDRLSPEQVSWLQDFADRFERETLPVAVDSLVEEFARWRANNRLAPEGRPDYLRMTHDATMDLSRQMGEEAGNEMSAIIRRITERQLIDPTQNTEQFIAALRERAEYADRGTVEIALNELADQMESEFMRDWEPEVTPTNAVQQPANRQEVAQAIRDMSAQRIENLREINMDLGNQMDTIVTDTAEFYPPATVPHQFANSIRGAGITAESETLRTSLTALANAVDAIINAADQQRAAPAPATAAREPMITTEMADIIDTISNAVGENTTPGVGNRVGTIAYRIAQAVDARANPAEYAAALRGYGTANEHVAVASGLRGIADLIEERTRDVIPAPMAFRAPSQAEASAIMGGIESEFDMQIDALRDGVNDNAVRMFSNTFGTLLRERGLDNVTIDTLPELGRALDGLRTDIVPQIASARAMGFEGVAVADALMNMSLAIRDRLVDLEPVQQLRGADLDNMRNDRIIQVEDTLNNPESDPNDLRAMAFAMSGMGNMHWAPLAENERRDYAQALRQRANYIEFNPRDFAQRLMGEEGPEHYDDAITLLENNQYDHETLRGLPPIERPRAAQATAVEMGRLIRGQGGPVRGYQKGGSVKADVSTPWLFSVPTYSETVAYEMYPGQKGQDDQRDAARHMLAAGTLSRKYGPGVAEFMGKAHEYVTSPLQAVKTLFGGKMPADFGMDTHNNAVGAQLGQRAKSQAELEDLVQAEAERASRTQTPGQAFIKRANGGIVQQNPTPDQMRYALMMRRK